MDSRRTEERGLLGEGTRTASEEEKESRSRDGSKEGGEGWKGN